MNSYAPSRIAFAATEAGAAAKEAENAKCRKYEGLSQRFRLQPVAFETTGTCGPSTRTFVKELGNRLTAVSGDRRETEWLRQRLSIAVARGNAASVVLRVNEASGLRDMEVSAMSRGGSQKDSGEIRDHKPPGRAPITGDSSAAYPSLTPPEGCQMTLRSSQGTMHGAARVSRSTPVSALSGPTLTGLKNLGNTCYLNSVVQCVSNTPSFKEFFLGDAYQQYINYDSELSHGEAAQELAAAVKAIWSGQYRTVALYDLKDVMGRCHFPFRGSAQQDAHEFLIYLLDFLHEDLNKVPRKKPVKEQENDNTSDQHASQVAWDDFKSNNCSFVLNLFWGQMKSTLHCSHCGKESVKWEAFSHLSVPMPESSSKCSLQECLHLHMARERVEGWRCHRCKCSMGATKALDLWHLPPILVIHIQRFYNDGRWRKKQSIVDFPLENLDMSPYVTNPQARYLRDKYLLYGVVNHYGDMEGGHYTAFCKSQATGRWHKFDDDEVCEMKEGDVQTSAAYILFYSAIDGKI
ncbi:MAG: ubiquitin carboxyl-terminal hydrolase family protein [Cyanobacteria bacterium J06598_3]